MKIRCQRNYSKKSRNLLAGFFCCNTGISKVNTEKGCGFCENALLTAHLSSKLSIAIWRRCIENQPAIPSKTDGNGGNLTDGEI